MTSSTRALRMESIVQEVDRILHPGSSMKPTEYRAKFDWHRDGTRVECKYAKLLWNNYFKRWTCRFSGIKLALPGVRSSAYFDELLLAIYSPRGIHVFRHNGTFGVSTNGKDTVHYGFSITVTGPVGQEDACSALDVILTKFEAGGCKQLARLLW
ncbi:unnamed protein product [Polarella glacialis]|uniref:Uncharacterized protein n=1 Tax=Polarella glacialis TaxID=89957 RepID=A0A813I7A0_POLGL|nr:unnamed protein product [Polarella glacialis]